MHIHLAFLFMNKVCSNDVCGKPDNQYSTCCGIKTNWSIHDSKTIEKLRQDKRRKDA